jgi:hypothetical protein
MEGLERDWYNLQLQITNPTTRNMYVHLELPAFIDLKTNQVFADQWGRDDFVAGMIYAGASVKTNAQFRTAKLGDRPPGGTIALTYHERRETPVTFHISTRVKGEACYLITYCYTRESAEYAGMVSFRDEKLRASQLGQWSIDVYYRFSPWLITWSDRNRLLRFMVRFLVKKLVPGFLNVFKPDWKK